MVVAIVAVTRIKVINSLEWHFSFLVRLDLVTSVSLDNEGIVIVVVEEGRQAKSTIIGINSDDLFVQLFPNWGYVICDLKHEVILAIVETCGVSEGTLLGHGTSDVDIFPRKCWESFINIGKLLGSILVILSCSTDPKLHGRSVQSI